MCLNERTTALLKCRSGLSLATGSFSCKYKMWKSVRLPLILNAKISNQIILFLLICIHFDNLLIQQNQYTCSLKKIFIFLQYFSFSINSFKRDPLYNVLWFLGSEYKRNIYITNIILLMDLKMFYSLLQPVHTLSCSDPVLGMLVRQQKRATCRHCPKSLQNQEMVN